MSTTSAGPVVPYPAQASVDGKLIADSAAAVRVDRPGAAPLLWFPRADVEAATLDTLDADAWQAGDGDLADHVAFDFERVDLSLVDAAPGGDERDATIKRFPTRGDAVDLVDVMDVRPESETHFVSPARADWRRPVVEGSQMLGQAIVAGSRYTGGRRAVSASMVFTRAANAHAPYAIDLDPVSSGRTFAALGVRVTQGERTCAAGTLLMDVTAPDVIRHGDAMPDVAGPYDSTPYDMSVTGRDLRIVDDAYTGDSHAPVGPPVLDTWVRFRDLPDDPAIHAGLVAQFTGHISIAAGLRPHAGIGQDQAHVTLSTAISAISFSLHTAVRADQWLLYHHHSTFAGDGMTHSECRVYEEAGALVASFTVDAMVRAFDDPSRGDARTAL